MLYRTSPFSHFARWTALRLGNPVAFVTAVLIIIVWAMLQGPLSVCRQLLHLFIISKPAQEPGYDSRFLP